MKACERRLWTVEKRLRGQESPWCGRLGLTSTMDRGQRRHRFVMCAGCRERYRALGWRVVVNERRAAALVPTP